MTQKHYYQASGELLVQLHDWFKQAGIARRKMLEFGERHGAASVNIYGGSSPSFALVFPHVPSNPLWKLKNGDWVPKQSTKAGKALAAEMVAISKEHPTAASVGDVIGMKMFAGTAAGLVWRTPQMVQAGKKRELVLLGVPDDYKVPKKLRGQLTRISDVEFEQLMALKPVPARPRRPRSKPRT